MTNVSILLLKKTVSSKLAEPLLYRSVKNSSVRKSNSFLPKSGSSTTTMRHSSTTVYSIIESAKANGLNPYKYLYYIFSELLGIQFGQHPEFLEDYLPWSPEVQDSCKKTKT